MGRKKKKNPSAFGLEFYTDPILSRVLESWPNIRLKLSQYFALTTVALHPEILICKEDLYGDKAEFEQLFANHIDFVLEALKRLRENLDPEKMSMRDSVTLYIRTHPGSCEMRDDEIVLELKKNYGITLTSDTVKKTATMPR